LDHKDENQYVFVVRVICVLRTRFNFPNAHHRRACVERMKQSDDTSALSRELDALLFDTPD